MAEPKAPSRCIAFGTSSASPTAPTYQIYDLPKTVEVRLYMESNKLQCILSEISEWEQVAGTERSRWAKIYRI